MPRAYARCEILTRDIRLPSENVVGPGEGTEAIADWIRLDSQGIRLIPRQQSR